MYMQDFLLLLLAISYVIGFNIDTKNNYYTFSLTGSGRTTSYFGYAVSLQYVGGEIKLVSTAPRFNSNGEREGDVFYCDMNNFNNCTKLPLTKGPGYGESNIGFTFSQSGSEEQSLTCAPLYHYPSGQFQRFKGSCTIFNRNLIAVYNNIPCQGRGDSQNDYGFCNAGFDSAASRKGNMFFVGAPGAFSYKGAVFVVQGDRSFGSNQTLNPVEEDISSLMGYSITWGNFSGSQHGDIATGAPRADTLRGKVHIMTVKSNLELETVIPPLLNSAEEQIGSFFGATVCAVDLNNDGRDDLLVGAPMYSKEQNEGKVYIYMNKLGPFNGFGKEGSLEGDATQNGQFGMSIVNLGDVNGDGFSDVAISAPFGGSDGTGAVYIYNGGSDGIQQAYSQVIYASTVPLTGRGFGYAISRAVDVDNNGYPDLAIGSYSVGTVHVFRTRAVISLSDKLETNVTSVPPEEEKSNCVGPDGKKYHCIMFEVNLQDTGSKSPASFDIEITIELDRKRSFSNRQRAVIFDPVTNMSKSLWTQNITMTRGELKPFSTLIYVTVGVNTESLDSPIEISTQYKVATDCISDLCPILDIYGKSGGQMEVPYLVQCSNAICTTDVVILNATVSVEKESNTIIYGSTTSFSVDMIVTNYQEPAYQAMVRMNYSSDFKVLSISVDGTSHLWTDNNIAGDTTMKELSFIVANPMVRGKNLSVSAKFSVLEVQPSVEKYKFSMFASSPLGVDQNLDNNGFEVIADTKIETCLNVVGDFSPLVVTYDANELQPKDGANISDVGPELTYTFTIYNNGRLDVESLLVNVETLTRKESYDFLYIADLTANGLRCSDEVNPRNFMIPKVKNPDEREVLVVQNDQGRKRRSIDSCNTADSATCKSVFTCSVPRIDKTTNAKIVLTTRIWSANAGKLKLKVENLIVNVSVSYDGPQKHLKYSRSPTSCTMSQSISSVVVKEKVISKPDKLEWWWVLLAILGALIALAIVCAILYRVGFFDRNRDFSKQFEEEQQQELGQTETYRGIDADDIEE